MKNKKTSNAENFRKFVNSVNVKDLDNENNVLFCYNISPCEGGDKVVRFACNMSITDFYRMIISNLIRNFKPEQAKILSICLIFTFYKNADIHKKILETLSEEEQIRVVKLLCESLKEVGGEEIEK